MSGVSTWLAPVAVALIGAGVAFLTSRDARKAKTDASEAKNALLLQQNQQAQAGRIEEVYGKMYDRAQGVNDRIVAQLREEVDRLSAEVTQAREEIAAARSRAITTEERNAELERRLGEQERKYVEMERRLHRMQTLIEQLRSQGVPIPDEV